MAHYAHVVSVSRLQFEMLLGFLPDERQQKQQVEISFRLYFPGEIDCNRDDEADFFDYGMLSAAIRDYAQQRRFNLIEFAAMQLFQHLRSVVDSKGGEAVKLWLQLNKIQAPVPGLLGGASFVHSDLPPDATFIPSQLL